MTRLDIESRRAALEQIRRRGKTVRAWAQEHGLSERVVWEVLGGRKKGLWGQSHKAAVLLGLKDGVLE
ncbi:MAG: DNA-binding protein [Burkholderiales bacterium]